MKKKLFAVYYAGKLGLAMQPVKADDSEAAKSKFMKKSKLDEDFISGDIEEIEPTHKRYGFFKNHAI